jgi:hypothetical protein
MRRGMVIVFVLLALVTVDGCSGASVMPEGIPPSTTEPSTTTAEPEKPSLVVDDNMKQKHTEVEGMASLSMVQVIGTVTNKSASAIGGIEIKFNLFDDNGDPIGTAWTYLGEDEPIAPGASWLYEALYTGKDAPKVTKAVLAALVAD